MIPKQLVGEGRFIKIEPESKSPEHSPEGPFFEADSPELAHWIESGGNVGLNLGPLVAIDVDHSEFEKLLTQELPPTFTVRSGSGGTHRYYRCSWEGRRQFTSGNTDYGSLRSGNWYTVIPPSIHPNGNRYQTLDSRPVQKVPESALKSVIQEAEESGWSGSANTGRGGGGGSAAAAPRVGGSPIPSIPPEYPNKPAEWETLRAWLSSNGFLEELNLSSGDRSGREFKIAKCLAEGGFSEQSISDVLSRLPHNSKWHQRDSEYRRRTVRKAIVAACEDRYVSFDDSPDDARNGEPSRGIPRSTRNMADYTDHEEVSILEGSEDGDSFKKVVRTVRSENGDSVEYVSIKSGRIEKAETVDGDEVLTQRVTDSTSIGSPEYIGELAEALQELSEKIDN